MTETVLELRNVDQTFKVKQGLLRKRLPLRAVSGVSLILKRGEIIGLVGESGCGKSTLAKIILGILPPTTGEVLLGGKAIQDVPRMERAKKIQPIFQDPYLSLNPRKTVSQIIGLPLSLAGQPGGEARRREIMEMLDLVGLPRRVEHAYPSQMSGGQRQRVAIARALISRPEIVICDEPTSALDVSVQSQILNLLSELKSELNLTYLLISHNLSVIEHLADRVMVMYLGRIVESGITETVFDNPHHPYTDTLSRASLPPTPGHGLPDLALGTEFPNPINPPPGCSFHPRCPRAFDQCTTQRPGLTEREAGSTAACHLDSLQ